MRNLQLRSMLRCLCNLFFLPVSHLSGRRNILTSAKLSRSWPSNLHWLRSFSRPSNGQARNLDWLLQNARKRWMMASYIPWWWQQLCHPSSMLYLSVYKENNADSTELYDGSVIIQHNKIGGSKLNKHWRNNGQNQTQPKRWGQGHCTGQKMLRWSGTTSRTGTA